MFLVAAVFGSSFTFFPVEENMSSRAALVRVWLDEAGSLRFLVLCTDHAAAGRANERDQGGAFTLHRMEKKHDALAGATATKIMRRLELLEENGGTAAASWWKRVLVEQKKKILEWAALFDKPSGEEPMPGMRWCRTMAGRCRTPAFFGRSTRSTPAVRRTEKGRSKISTTRADYLLLSLTTAASYYQCLY